MVKKLFQRKVKAANSRNFKRFRADFLVKYQVDGKGETYITNARDVSAGGLRVWSERPLHKSSILHVSVFLPPLRRTVEALAQVLRVRRVKKGLLFSVGVGFLDLKQEDREAISKFSKELSDNKETRFLIDHADIVIRRE